VPEIIQRSFTSGEISPSLQSRADIVKYSTGLNLCENFFVRAQGGVYSRPGFRFIGELDDSSKVGRLIPFSFNTEQTYILVFEHLKMRVIKDGGFVLAGAGPALYELTTPYTEAQLSRLSYTQSADVMTIVHPDHDPKNLNRIADDNWTLTTISYASTVTAPTFASSDVATITNITQANPAVVTTAAAHGFSTGNIVDIAGVVGMTEVNGNTYRITVLTTTTFELDGVNSTGYGAYTSGGTATRATAATTIGSGFGDFEKTYTYVVTAVKDGVESLASGSASVTTESLSTTGGVRLTWNAVSGADYYRVYKDPSNNTQIYGWIGDSNNTSFDDYNIAPITSDAPPEDRQPFTGANNKPSTVNYYQQRQVFANTTNEPQATYTTQTNNFNSLRTSNPARDDDAVTFTINAQQVNEIRHIISLDAMILLTSGGEWKVTEGRDEVLTPSTIGVKIQSYNGASWVKPVVINSTALYLQEKGARLRDLGYEFSSDKYTGNDLSLMSEHLFEDQTIIEMAFANEPYGILWCVRDDGVLLGLTYQREHQVWGWHQHDTSGEFESVATISEDDRDALYAIVKRTIDGSTVRYVERLEKRESKIAEDAFYVDSGLSYTGLTAVVTGATQANPVVITTLTSHGYTNGESVRIEDIVGMTELNDNIYTVANATATTFELSGVDGTAFTAYSEGGNSLIVITAVSGLDHLEGEAVDILADGYTVEGKTVSTGSVTLDRAANKVHVGLSYTPAIELLDIDQASATESVKSKSVSVSKVIIEVEGTRGGFIGAREDATSGKSITFREIKPRFDADGYDPIALRTYKQEVIIDPQWSKGGGVRIEQRAPLPMAILSVIPRIDIGGS
jgi:hypothetical protein